MPSTLAQPSADEEGGTLATRGRNNKWVGCTFSIGAHPEWNGGVSFDGRYHTLMLIGDLHGWRHDLGHPPV
jgi:hypothetical protein